MLRISNAPSEPVMATAMTALPCMSWTRAPATTAAERIGHGAADDDCVGSGDRRKEEERV